MKNVILIIVLILAFGTKSEFSQTEPKLKIIDVKCNLATLKYTGKCQ